MHLPLWRPPFTFVVPCTDSTSCLIAFVCPSAARLYLCFVLLAGTSRRRLCSGGHVFASHGLGVELKLEPRSGRREVERQSLDFLPSNRDLLESVVLSIEHDAGQCGSDCDPEED